MTARRDLIAIAPGSGGVYSPHRFTTSALRADLAVPAGDVRVCAGGAAGLRGERLTPDGPLRRSVLWAGQVGASARAGEHWSFGVDLRGERASTDWRQHVASVRIARGAPVAAAPADPSLPGSLHSTLPPRAALCPSEGGSP
jgi:hypothetical protein